MHFQFLPFLCSCTSVMVLSIIMLMKKVTKHFLVSLSFPFESNQHISRYSYTIIKLFTIIPLYNSFTNSLNPPIYFLCIFLHNNKGHHSVFTILPSFSKISLNTKFASTVDLPRLRSYCSSLTVSSCLLLIFSQ